MKNHLKRLLALGLTLALTLTLTAPTACASDALGTDRKGRTTLLAPGVSVTGNSLWSATYSDLRTESYITYTPGGQVTPLLWYGGNITQKETLSAAARKLAGQGYRVLAGINGGFFNTDATPVGLILTDGVIRSIDRWNYNMVGFLPDGSAFVDSSTVTKSVRWQDALGQPVSLTLAAINGSRQNGGIYLYDDDFGTSTQNTYAGVDVLLEPVTPGAKPTMNGSVALRVLKVTDSTQEGVAADNSIPAGCYVLSANKNCEAGLLDPLRALTPGTEVTVDVTGADPRWTQAVCGVTGLYALVKNGQVVSGLEAGAAPRTALGVKADGSTVFYTIDGRQSGYSVGATYTQVANRLIELGCVTAVALDGGGSTTLGATLPGSDSFSTLNRPSGSTQRAVTDTLFLVTTVPASGTPDRFYVSAAQDVLLTGADTTVTAAAADAMGYAAFYAGLPEWSSDGGTVQPDGQGGAVFTAGDEAGVYEITAAGQGVSGSAPVRVVDQLTVFTIKRRDTGKTPASITLKPGESVELDASGIWYNLPVAMDDGDVAWSVEGEVGSIDGTGLYTAGEVETAGAVVAQAGGRTVRIPVTVDRGDPFPDIKDHWSREYVRKIYEMGLTEGVPQPDGTYKYLPDANLTRQEVLTFISRLLGADTALYAGVELPFADADRIPEWALPHVKTLYAMGIFKGAARDGALYADLDVLLSREMILTMLGRLLSEQAESDLSVFPDAGQISAWAAPYVKTMLANGVISGGSALGPQSPMTRGELAMLLVRVSALTPQSDPIETMG